MSQGRTSDFTYIDLHLSNVGLQREKRSLYISSNTNHSLNRMGTENTTTPVVFGKLFHLFLPPFAQNYLPIIPQHRDVN